MHAQCSLNWCLCVCLLKVSGLVVELSCDRYLEQKLPLIYRRSLRNHNSRGTERCCGGINCEIVKLEKQLVHDNISAVYLAQ